MRKPTSIYLTMAIATSILAASPNPASAQVPDASTTPRLAVPARGAAPAPAAAPAVQPPGQPTAAAAPEPAPVTAAPPPSGVTQLPPAAAAPATSSSSQAATAAATRGYVAGRFGLTLDGLQIGWLRSVEGGAAWSEVVIERPGPGNVAAKHLAGLRYEDISVTTDLQSKGLSEWIAASWKSGAPRKNGSIQSADYNNTVVSEQEFFNALLVETTLPALDGASKDAAHITVKIAPEYTRLKPGTGAKAQAAADTKTQRKWLASTFKFEMAGLDATKVNKIDSFTVGQRVQENPVGEMRDYEKAPGVVEFPNLRITLAASSAKTWLDWHNDFVIKGNNGAGQERSGAIVYLDASMKEELGRVNLSNCGIFKLSPAKVESGSEQLQRLVAELYCEQMNFIPGK
jgi:hypothetical protein